MSTKKIRLDLISADPGQPRKLFDAGALQELADSIKANGLIQPITVRPHKKRFIVITGERRWRAHKLAGLRTIECHVRNGVAGAQLRLKQIAENMLRVDMEPMEEARVFAELRDVFGFDAARIAKDLGLAEFRVAWRLSLLNLSPPIAKMVEAGQIDKQLALEAARLTSHADQTRLIKMANRGDLVGWKAIRAAADTMLGDISAQTLFGEDAPSASADDIRTLSDMEAKIERLSRLVSAGWKEGGCIIAAKVSPDRAQKIAQKIDAIRSALSIMSRELYNVSAQARMIA
jgi:ParB family transcriptional regulator, chromosome partitioning protein